MISGKVDPGLALAYQAYLDAQGDADVAAATSVILYFEEDTAAIEELGFTVGWRSRDHVVGTLRFADLPRITAHPNVVQVVVPIGGAQAVARQLSRFGPRGSDLIVAGLCDEGEEEHFRNALAGAGLGAPQNRSKMEQLGFFVCAKDLEDELICASDLVAIEALLDAQGDLGSFRTLQKQPAWRRETFEAQMHRWLRAGARRNLRYARLLILALEFDRITRPLKAVLAVSAPPTRRAGHGRSGP